MIEPFLKWAGGKRWLGASNQLPALRRYTRYIEPFLGGGALFFHLAPKKALLADINQDLIELYEVIRDEPKVFREKMFVHHQKHNSEYYYEVRSVIPEDRINRAARMLYLNRTCWNGLYRVNLKGKFNVPVGTKTKVLDDGEDFLSISHQLKRARIQCCDFEVALADVGRGDLIFLDPPYTVKHNLNGFVKYNEVLFSWEDQIRLRNSALMCAEKGAAVIVTNADHPTIHELYENVFTYTRLTRASVLAGPVANRGPTSEAMFLANT